MKLINYKRTTIHTSNEPSVTLTANGIIGLNSAVTRNILGDNKFAHFLFSSKERVIGLRFHKHKDADSYPVKCTKNRSHAAIAGISFLKTFGIFPNETTAYPATFLEKSKTLIVNISGKKTNKPAPKKRQRRERKAMTAGIVPAG